MLKNKSIDYIFGMITGIAVTITFWACTNTDLIASNDTGGIQQVEITNWSAMPAVTISGTPEVKISSSGNNVDIGNWSSMPSQENATFPSTIDVNIKSFPIFDELKVDIEDIPDLQIRPTFPTGFKVDIDDIPAGCCD